MLRRKTDCFPSVFPDVREGGEGEEAAVARMIYTTSWFTRVYFDVPCSITSSFLILFIDVGAQFCGESSAWIPTSERTEGSPFEVHNGCVILHDTVVASRKVYVSVV